MLSLCRVPPPPHLDLSFHYHNQSFPTFLSTTLSTQYEPYIYIGN
jgi:hypothetical protein